MAKHNIRICNVEVDFPFQPYPCQVVYMEKVIQCLQQGTNAILESPTGTGKTLCLLCATLGWREDLLRRQQAECLEGEEEDVELDPWDAKSAGGNRHANIPKIIYASRTHSQLAQVIHELKNTRYRPRVAIIGSREQLCIHPEVAKKETNSEKVHLCRAKVQSHSCIYFNNTDVKRLKTIERVLDIEDLVLAGSRQRMCPYYLARDMKAEADVIFMPYNYILDIKTRQMHGVDIQGTVIILDEAHNIEKVCEESASFDLTSIDIAHCIDDVGHILKAKVEEQSASADEGDEMGDDIQDFLNLKEFFLSVEKNLDSIQFSDPTKRELVKPSSYIFEFFSSAGLSHSTFTTLTDQCGKAISVLTSDARSVHRNGNNLQKFMDAAKIIFSQPSGPGSDVSSQHYKVFLKVEEAKKKKADVWTVASTDSSKKQTRTLSYWCFSPGHAMTELTAQGVRSIVLTSGTLSPLDSFSSELQIDFPISYEGPHVISQEQVWVGVVTKGCDGVPLNSSYANRSNVDYQCSLGNTIVNFSRIVPYGLLVFFPSYPVMYGCMDIWREKGILQRIEQYKPVFQEPRRKADFNPTMDAFYEKIADPKYNGATFFAVCRGKVSEGLDFADVNGRAVIITGLPYPPRMDPRITLKMQYLEESRKQSHSRLKDLSGEVWYRQQASRAVNQAIGRVIRHKNDYGAIILCDERFAYSSAVNQLPRWVRPYAKTYDKFGLVQRDLTQFFRNAEKQFGNPAPKRQLSAGEASSSHQSGDIRMPIVVKDHSNSHKATVLQAQDACVVDTHFAGKRGQLPQASLAKLKVERGKEASSKSLLSSLDRCESTTHSVNLPVPVTEPPPGPSLSESIISSDGLQASATAPKAPSKKVLLVSKKQNRVASAAGFITELQNSLSDEAYENFKKALGSYRKNHNVYEFTESLKDIFNNPSTYHLLQGMYTFILEPHKETYGLFYHEVTGKVLTRAPSAQVCKRKGSSMKEEPKRKMPKTTDKDQKSSGCFQHSTAGKRSTTFLSTNHLNTEIHLSLNHGKQPDTDVYASCLFMSRHHFSEK